MFPLFDTLNEDQRRTVEILNMVPGWPADYGKDSDYVLRLGSEFPGVDLRAEALKWLDWMEAWRELHPRKRVAHRARFTNWVVNAAKFAGTGRKTKPAELDEIYQQELRKMER
jgi:hypothetical protein